MMYGDLYLELKNAFNSMEKYIELDDLSLRIRRMDFHSASFDRDTSSSLQLGGDFKEEFNKMNIPPTCQLNGIDDCSIQSNVSFNYYIFENTKTDILPGVIFLFHGLNEKKWDKYLPWAYELTKQTGKSVILFPIAFHMNRAPFEWSDIRLMSLVSKIRSYKETNSHSSFANAALSERLEILPQRFFWSGFQTYIDFCTLIRMIRLGQVKGIPKFVDIDLFGYSIGAFFSLLLMLDNPDNLLNNSRLFIFCGGATYDKTFPVSKYIIDTSAYNSVTFYFDELFRNRTLTEKKMDYYFSDLNPKQSHFGCIMNYRQFKDLREKRLAEIHEKIHAIVLSQDDVIRPDAVIGTLKGESGNIKTNVETMDFNYPYTHISPFPSTNKDKNKVDYYFKTIFEQASSFYS